MDGIRGKRSAAGYPQVRPILTPAARQILYWADFYPRNGSIYADLGTYRRRRWSLERRSVELDPGAVSTVFPAGDPGRGSGTGANAARPSAVRGIDPTSTNARGTIAAGTVRRSSRRRSD